MFNYSKNGELNEFKVFSHIIIGGIVAILLLIAIFSSWAIINAGERGIVLNLGKINRVLEPGIHWKTPFIETVVKINVQTQKEQVKSTAASKDLQTVEAVVALNYNLQDSRIKELYSKVGESYKTKIIDPAIQESIKAATAKYTAEELITKRPLVRDEIKASLSERLNKEYIDVTEVSIVNFDFSDSFNNAIEKKVTAEQDALAAKNKLEQVKFEAEQKVATAEAEAKAIRLASEAANNEKYVSLKRLEVQLEFAKRWNGVLPINLYGSAPIPFLNLEK